MSRIGKKPIDIPSGVEVKIEGDEIFVKGPKGELSLKFRREAEVEKNGEKIVVSPGKKSKNTKALWGLYRALIANMVKGVSEGFEKKLEIRGVGYKARVEGDYLILSVGFSHEVKVKKPEGIDFSVEKNIITVSGIDKEKVGQIAAKIRDIRPPEPYKGKGIRYLGEEVRTKVAKKAVASG